MPQVSLEPYAARLYWHFESPPTGRELRNILTDFFDLLARRCLESGAALIGHIKGIVLLSDGSFMKISVVSGSMPAQAEGSLPDDCSDLALDLNAHVYGVSRELMRELVAKASVDPDASWAGRASIAMFGSVRSQP